MSGEGPGAVAQRLAYRFGDPDLLARALTHPSYAHEHPPEPHNETLAFLGDAALGLVVAEVLRERTPDAGPGLLTPRRAAIVSAPALARWAARLDLGPALRLGRGEAQGRGGEKESVLATALEAVVGALYLDGGLAPVRALVLRLMAADRQASPPDREPPPAALAAPPAARTVVRIEEPPPAW